MLVVSNKCSASPRRAAILKLRMEVTRLLAMNPSVGWKTKTCTDRPLINDQRATTLSRVENVPRYFRTGFMDSDTAAIVS